MSGGLTDAARRDWLRLARSENVGPVTFEQLVRRYGDATKALAALPELSRRGGRSAALRIPAADDAEREIAAGEALGARLIGSCEPDFPAMLAALDPPPPLIWARGQTDLLGRPAVAIVGARIASAGGQRFARTLAGDLGQADYVVISGMARGIDGAAHEGALASGTVAVLGGGVDDVYPPDHQSLYEKLVSQGCVVSESPPGAKAQARDFPRRNRLIAGLSLAVVVVEAELRSGSLITARLAAEQGREVLAVPGSPLDPRARGTNDLIRQGAALCEGADDVLRAISGISSIREPERGRYDEGGETGDDAETAALRERIAKLLSPTPTPRDDLVRITGAPAAAVYAALTELALANRAELLPGGLAIKA
ncbi:MAG TPA: DNA-processing protein DprA [Caulobacteraceae bacterium]|nr:DNA-processing protein DprA [Caulobacteraceae bacterium]